MEIIQSQGKIPIWIDVAGPRDMPDSVFISYAREDLAFVENVAERLNLAGIECWYDKSLRGGESWPREMQRRLEESRVLIVVVTPAARASDWVLREVLSAQKLRLKIVPYRLEKTDGFLALADLQHVATFVDLMSALGVSCTPPSVPPNPFLPLAGRVEAADLFFDRDSEVEQAFDCLNAGSSVALIGPREVGKSSLAWRISQLAAERLDPARSPIFLDLQQVNDEGDFYEALCCLVGVETCRGFRLSRALHGKRFLLVLDEFEKMSWEGFGRSVRAELRGLAEGQFAPMRLLVAARTPLDRLFPDSEGMTSPLAGICLQIDLKNWGPATIREFVASRLRATPIRFSEEDLERVRAASQGHPRRLAMACHQIYKQRAKELA